MKFRFVSLIILLALGSATNNHAAPMHGKLDQLKQPDGTVVLVRIWGDEYFQHVESLDGRTLVRDPDTGEICYADLSADGSELISTGVKHDDTAISRTATTATTEDTTSRGFNNPIRINAAARDAEAQRMKELLGEDEPHPDFPQLNVTSTTAPESAPPSIPAPSNILNGNYLGLTLLIDFSDEPATISNAEINNFCNQTGYSGFGNNGSVRDYFEDISGGMCIYSNHVTVYYRAANPKSYYEDPNVSYGTRARELIREALDNLENNIGFDFSTLSLKSSNTIRALNILYAGNASSGWSKGLWPHKASITWSADGVNTGSYQISDIETQITLSTFCHENGHMLCYYPDLYDYGYESRGVGNYDLMCGSNSRNPCPPNAYFRHKNGWETLINITDEEGVTPHEIASNSNTNYVYVNSKNTREFFVIESRTKTGRSANIPGNGGLMIWHVDMDGSNNNEQMTPSQHYRVSLEQADGDYDLENNNNGGDDTDLFHAGYRSEFDDFTPADAKWWDGTGSGLAIKSIGAIGATMTFETHNVELIESDAVLEAIADAYVKTSAAGSNFGTDTKLAARSATDGDASELFIKFDVSGITNPADTAELRLTVVSNPDGGSDELFLIADDSWTETGITYNNRPSGDIRIAEINPTIIPDTATATLLIGGALNNGNLDDDSVVTETSSETWSTKVADTKYYIAANPTGSGYYTGWMLSRLGTYPGGNNTIGMLTYAHPTAFDSGTTPDFCAFANSGGVQIESDPVSAALAGGDGVTVEYKVSTLSSPGTFSGLVDFIFDKGLPTETTIAATPTATVPLTQVTYNGSSTAYAGTFAASADVPADHTTVSVRVGVQNSTSAIGVSLDDVELSHTSTGISLYERQICIDVSDAVRDQVAGDGTVTFCLSGGAGLVEYGSRESGHEPQLVVSQLTETDSALIWEVDGALPDGQWTYGYYPQYGPASAFTPYPKWTSYYSGSQSWIGGLGKIWDHAEGYPRVGKYASSPYGTTGNHTIDTTARVESVRRWTSNIQGIINIVSDLQQIQSSNDGNIVRIRKNGVTMWTHDLRQEYRKVDTLQMSVKPGDVIDFAVDPINNHSADWIYWRTRISSLPRTANRSALLAYYDFDEASDMPTDADGDQYDRKMFAFDYGGSENHAALMNADTWTVWNNGMMGNAIVFDGINDYVQTPVSLDPADGAHAVAMWVQGGAAGQTLIGQTAGADWLALGSGDIAWRHIAMVWDGAERRTYIDGEEVAVNATTPASGSGTLLLGSGNGSPFSGMLDDLGIWARALSAKEVESMYLSGMEGRTLAHVKSFVDNSVEVYVDLNQSLYNYDLGPVGAPVQNSWTALTPNMVGDIYWESSVSATDRGASAGVNHINRDFIHGTANATLQVRVANGFWHATINAGDTAQAHDNIRITCADGGVTGTASPAAGETPYIHLDGFVEDGFFTLDFSDEGGSDPEWVITRLSLRNDDDKDYDGDGIDNRTEYVLGGNPMDDQSQGIPPEIAINGSGLDYVYRMRNDTNLTAMILSCTNLAEDCWMTNTVQLGTGGSGMGTYTNNLSTDGEQVFYKLIIE